MTAVPEADSSTLLLPKSATGKDPDPISSTLNPSNYFKTQSQAFSVV
jgi:hypothetical protein